MKKFVCVMQDGIKDCGVSCLLTIIRTYDGDVPKEYLKDLTNTTKDGVSAFSLLEAGRKLGFDVKGVSGNFLDIEDKYLPCIAHVIIDSKYKHFVVIHKIDRKKENVIIADPAKGIVKISFDDFLKVTTNNFLFFTPNTKIPYIKISNSIINQIIQFLVNDKPAFVFLIFLALIFIILQITISFSFQFIIEKSISFNSKYNLYLILLVICLLYVFKDVTQFLQNRLLNFISHKLDYILINNTFSHILSLPHLYYKSRTTGEIVSRINDLGEIRDSISHLIVTFLVDFILVIFVLIFMFFLSKTITVIILLIMFVYIITTVVFNRILYRKIRIIKENGALANSYMIELISGADSVKGMNIFSKILDKFKVKYNNYVTASYNFSLISNIEKLLTDFMTSLIFFSIMLSGSILVIDGKLSLGQLITYNALIYYFIDPIKNIINFDIITKRIKIIVERMNELLSIKGETLMLDSNKLSLVNGDIKIDKLSFSYNNRDYLFKNLSLQLKKGEKVVICGNSGSGKSTIAKIISRYVPIDRGFVYIDNKDINDYNLFSLRENITYVSQCEFIFTDSIYNNVNIENNRVAKDVFDICKLMMVDSIVDKRKTSYDMLVEENGANLSGGERQRIILARTFLKESNIYILDESFSEIDVDSERKIIINLFEKYSDKTIIVISHRFDNNDLYDRIIDMKEVTDGN